MLFQEIIKVLLRHGANMGVKNWDERPPVNRILPATLQAPVSTQRKGKIKFNIIYRGSIHRQNVDTNSVNGMVWKLWIYFSPLGGHLFVSSMEIPATDPASKGEGGEISVYTFFCNLT
jgi:hypothetical protein